MKKPLINFQNIFKSNLLTTIKNLDAELNNNFSITFDKTYKVKEYNYSNSGKFKKGKLVLPKLIKNEYLLKEIKEIYFSNLQIVSSFNSKKSSIKGKGEYSFDNSNFLKVNFDNNFKNDLFNLKLDFDFNDQLDFNLINYTKPKNTIANLYLEAEKIKNTKKINKLNYKEDNNLIQIDDLIFKKDFISFKNIKIATKNNDFFIKKMKKFLLKEKVRCN